MNDKFVKALVNSQLLESKNAIDMISQGGIVLSDGRSCDNSLLQTYTIRLEHIQSISSVHARRLAAATAEFVSLLKLSGSEGGTWYTIKGDAEYNFNVFRLRSGEVIACLPVISRIESEDSWHKI